MKSVDALRADWDRAIERDKPADAVKALAALEVADPGEPQWSQRLGEALRRVGRAKDAEEAFERAMRRFADKGFLPRAIAMAKLVAAMNPQKSGLVAGLEAKPPATSGSGKPPPLLRPPPPLVQPAPLEPARDSLDDEVRFEDEPRSSIVFELGDVVELVVEDEAPPEPSLDRLATMASFRLFASLSPTALSALADASELATFDPSTVIARRGDPADALWAIVEGAAYVQLPDGTTVALGEGDVIGEGCLLDEGERQADVRAVRATMTLRIAKSALDAVVAAHPEVEGPLFDLLARRLVSNIVGTSALFAAFEPDVRLDLARMFEVRRAAAGVVLAQRGRRSDGLYVLVAGQVIAERDDGERVRVARGSAFGQGALLGGRPAPETVTASSEALVLRLPAARFATLAALYPPALAHLADTVDQPLRASVPAPTPRRR